VEARIAGSLEDAMNATLKSESYVMLLRSVGNPDYGQYAPVSEPAPIKGRTLTAMAEAAREYIEFWDLGGGNWPEPEIRNTNGQPVARISYNGRLWPV
jgi:hypothetical protein